ncbi:MAG: class I SAM-dependent rRNA methyltransferase [Verrucomicrobiota bacterium]|nr:class I SAM-dependent rRNA methyltransferase [Verrucomicrobiota bacterium]
MNKVATVLVKPGEADRLLAGHPWLYDGSVLRVIAEVNDGDVVQVKDHRQRFLGIGVYNSRSRIRVRLLDRERIPIDQNFFEQRIRSALELRQRHMPKATSFRLLNAESDFLSGLIIDKYEDVLVVQISSLGIDQRKAQLVAALLKILKPKAILERNDIGSRKFEGLPERTGFLHGESPAEIVIRLNGIELLINIFSGHKTGYYLDQQTNYQAVSDYAKGARVLDCFCFLGGFSLHAARAGAAHVHGLDQSAEAVAAAGENAKRNGLDSRCSFEAVNVFDWLKAQTTVGPHEKVIPKHDLIILDPPSFTKNRASVGDALRGYKEIHLRAFKLLRPGGTLATFCCSHHVDAQIFQQVILEAAFDAHKVLRRIRTYSQSPDHPIIPTIPETEYLKGFAFEIA